MSYRAKKCCRGCLGEVDPADAHSFSWPEIRGLFHDCTSLPILADEGHDLPQQICSECYNNCEKWFSFRTMCHEIDKHLRSVLAMDRSITSSDAAVDQDGYDTLEFGQLVVDEEEYEEMKEEEFGEQYEELEDGEVEYEEEEFEEIEDEEEEIEEMDDADDADYEEEEEDDEEEEEYDEPAYQKLDHPKISAPNTKPVCAKQFNRSSKVYPHFLEMHAEKEPQDENANDDLFTRQVQRTDKGKDSNTLHTCPICALKVSSLTMHLAEMHIPPGTRACPLCSRELSCRALVMRHLVVHTLEKPYSCPIGCSSKFTRFHSLCKHMKRLHTEAYLKIKWDQRACKICGKQFTHKAESKEHRLQHILNIEQLSVVPYKCSVCPKSFCCPGLR